MTACLRPTARLPLLALLALGLLVLLAGGASAQSVGAAEEQLVRRINEDRAAAGLRPLALNAGLTGAARGWTPRMAAGDRLAHNPDLAGEVAGSWSRLGENVGVARATGGESPTAAVDRLHRAFMGSPGHRANVLGDFDQVGVGARWAQDSLWITVNFSKGGHTTANGPIEEAVRVSRQLFADAQGSGRRAEYAVVARAEEFADALGGSGLAGDRAPILFTNGPTPASADPGLHSATAAEIDRILGGRGPVYLLGGSGAVSQRAAAELAAAGYEVRRLAGKSRYETSVRIAEEVGRLTGRGPSEVLLARAFEWADAVTGGAYAAATRSPVVLTGRDDLHPSARAFLEANRGARRVALGGTAAISDAVARAAGAQRVAGKERTATSVAVAEQLWGRRAAAVGDRFALVPGYNGDAWAYALALAPWSAVNGAPQLLVYDEVPAPVSGYLAGLGYRAGLQADVFAASPVKGPVRDRVHQIVRP